MSSAIGKRSSGTTQAMVAKVAGVSQQSVSQALNGTGRLTDEMRQHILGVAKHLNYSPNRSARALRKNEFGTVGLLGVCNSSASYISNMFVQHLQTRLADLDKFLTYIPVEAGDLDAFRADPATLGIDGAFVTITDSCDDRPGCFPNTDIPLIWVNSKLRQGSVYPDDFGGAYDFTSFLISQGYKSIGYVGFVDHKSEGIEKRHYSVRDRAQGYIDALRKSNMEPCTYVDEDLTTDVLRTFIEKATGTPVLICYELNPALRTLLVATALGLKLPGELKIVYFHSQPHWEDHLDSLVRCLPVPHDKLAAAAVEMYRRRTMGGEKDVESIRVKYDSRFHEFVLTSNSYFEMYV